MAEWYGAIDFEQRNDTGATNLQKKGWIMIEATMDGYGGVTIHRIRGAREDGFRSYTEHDANNIDICINGVCTNRSCRLIDFQPNNGWENGNWTDFPDVSGSGDGDVQIKIKVHADNFSNLPEPSTFKTTWSLGYLPITIKYNADGGDHTPASQVAKIGDSITLATTPMKDHFHASYWVGSDGTKWTSGGTYTWNWTEGHYGISGHVLNLKPLWEKDDCYVSFHPNGGSGEPSEVLTHYQDDFTIPNQTPTKSGYTFQYWEDSEGTRYYPGRTYNWHWEQTTGGPLISNVLFLSAVYTEDIQYYTLNLNGRLGKEGESYSNYSNISGYGKADVYARGSLVGNQVTDFNRSYREGSSYSIQNINADPGCSYDGVYSGSLSGNLYSSRTVYLQFTKKKYTISYNGNGGSNIPSDQYSYYNESFTVPNTIPSRTGYTFDYWVDSNGNHYQPGNTYTIAWDRGEHGVNNNYVLQLTASYTQVYFTLNLNGRLDGNSSNNIAGYGKADIYIENILKGNQVTDYNDSWDYGTSYEIKNITTEPHKIYKGIYSGSTSGLLTVDRTVVLEFETEKYRNYIHIYDPDNNLNNNIALFDLYLSSPNQNYPDISEDPGNDIMNQPYNSYFTVSNIRGKIPGYSLNNVVNYDEETTAGTYKKFFITANESLDIYMKYNDYTITYNANGGVGEPEPQTYTFNPNGSINLSNTIPTKEGYDFLGWALSSTATEIDYAAGGLYLKDNAEDITLYAVWREKAPSNLHINITGATYTSISLELLADGLNITNYTLYYKGIDDADYIEINLGTNNTTVLDNLPRESSYRAYFTATNSGGTSSSNIVIISTLMDQAKIRIKKDGTWQQGKAYYKKDGQWVKAKKVYIKKDGQWIINRNN